MTSELLSTFAMVKANADRGRTHLDGFGNFALDVMRDDPGRPFRPSEVSALVAETYAFVIPPHVMDAILGRLARTKWLVRANGEYTVADGKVNQLPNVRVERERFLREQRALANHFQTFVRERHGIDLSLPDAEEALFSQIERDAVLIITTEIKGGAGKATKIAQATTNFLASEFILWAIESDPGSYEWLLSAAKGATLAAVVNVPNLESVTSKFKRTTLYLDSPLLLQAAGLDGEEMQDAVLEILRLAEKYGANIAAFDHSVVEAQGVVYGTAHARRRPGKTVPRLDGVLATAIANDWDAGDLELRAAKLPDLLTGLNIGLVEKPDHVASRQVSELDLHDALFAAIGDYRNEAMLNDTDSLVGVHFLRGKHTPVSMEDARALLVTANFAVARVSHTFFKKEGYDFPMAVHVRDLATLLYLKSPQNAPDLPRLRMAANAYAALEPGPEMWTKWLALIDSQSKSQDISPGDVGLLCHTQESRRILMEMTVGSVERVSSQTVTDVLSRTKVQVAGEAHTQRLLAEANVVEMKGQADLAASRLQASEAALAKTRLKVRDRARRDANALTAIPFGVAILVGLLVIVANTKAGRELDWPWLDEFGKAANTMFIAVTILVLVFGGSVLGWAKQVRSHLVDWLERRRFAALDLAPDNERA